ncbi:MAG: hypothetical protein K0Q79_2579 [Flavipsychrobacter sp.]|nr:hypothetical protein [Flavipsychrobacter sp.]
MRMNVWFAVTTAVAVALVVFSLENFIIHADRVIAELGGDGAKNSFTYLYHSLYGKGYWFEGMNYPYGEHIVFTDGQPVISVLLASRNGINAGTALTVMWWLIGLSYVLSVLYLYKTLLHFKVSPFVSMVFACIIGIFTPQLLRLQGHYALSYTCIIPMLFYWTARYNDAPHWRYCVYFFVTGCIMAFIHPYYAAMLLVWVTAYMTGCFIFRKGPLSDTLKHTGRLFASAILVLAVMGVIMKLTDPVTDRPATPFNTIYETCTRLKQIVTSVHSPVWKPFVDTKRPYLIADGGEGYVYIGMVMIITLGICLVAGVMKSIKERRLNIIAGRSGFSPVWLFMAFTILLFSMGIPFKWHMERLMQYMGIFKQFRSLGRFSWIFYYIAAVYVVVVLYQFYEHMAARKKMVVAYGVVALAAGFWAYEASGYVQYARRLSKSALYNYDMWFSMHEQNWAGFLKEHQFAGTDFQAILMEPFFHTGTEKLWAGNPDWMITLAAKASLQLHLPVMDVMMSRSSWSQAMKQVKIDGGPFADKPVLRDIKSAKPLLMLRFDEYPINDDQRYLLEAAEYLGHFSQCLVYAFYPERLVANDRKHADSIEAILTLMSGQDTIINDHGTTYIDHFESGHAAHVFGNGGIAAIDKDSSVLAVIPMRPAEDSEVYEFSCWFLLDNKDYRSPYMTLELVNADGKKDTAYDALSTKSVDNHGMWFRASRYFTVKNSTREIRYKLTNVPKPTYLAMDELVLRPAKALVISRAPDGSVMVNNHLFKTKQKQYDQ